VGSVLVINCCPLYTLIPANVPLIKVAKSSAARDGLDEEPHPKKALQIHLLFDSKLETGRVLNSKLA